MTPLTMTVLNATKTLGIGRTKLYELLRAQEVRSISIGRRRLVLAEDIDSLVQRSLDEGSF